MGGLVFGEALLADVSHTMLFPIATAIPRCVSPPSSTCSNARRATSEQQLLLEYHELGRALRTELVVNDTYDFNIGRVLKNLPAL